MVASVIPEQTHPRRPQGQGDGRAVPESCQGCVEWAPDVGTQYCGLHMTRRVLLTKSKLSVGITPVQARFSSKTILHPLFSTQVTMPEALSPVLGMGRKPLKRWG